MAKVNKVIKDKVTEEQQAISRSFGEVILQIPVPDDREDMQQVVKLYSAILNMLHITLGGNSEHSVPTTLLSAAITEVISSANMTIHAMRYADEIGIELPTEEPTE